MSNALGSDEQLAVGDSRTSENGRYRLDMQADGNLVLYQASDGAPLWAAKVDGLGGTRAVMQDDGNLVIYGDSGPVWASQTAGNPGATLTVQDDGNVVIAQSATVLWATETAVAPEPVAVPEPVAAAVTETSAASRPVSALGTTTGLGLDRRYTTKAGDTLESLAEFFYGAAVHKQRLLDENPNLSADTTTLREGISIRVPEDPMPAPQSAAETPASEAPVAEAPAAETVSAGESPAPEAAASGAAPEAAMPEVAAPEAEPEAAPEAVFYTVQEGDTLWAIAQAQYGDGSKYPVIFEANRETLENPDLIHPGQVLRIPPQ